MTNTENPTRETMTREAWNRTSPDFRTGSPRAGTAAVVRWVEGVGTCLVPVEVVR